MGSVFPHLTSFIIHTYPGLYISLFTDFHKSPRKGFEEKPKE